MLLYTLQLCLQISTVNYVCFVAVIVVIKLMVWYKQHCMDSLEVGWLGWRVDGCGKEHYQKDYLYEDIQSGQ